jgi:hypothetical protein
MEDIMKNKDSEFEKFDKVMDGLLSVPYSELQKKLEEEKQQKAKRKKRATSSSVSSREVSARKERAG